MSTRMPALGNLAASANCVTSKCSGNSGSSAQNRRPWRPKLPWFAGCRFRPFRVWPHTLPAEWLALRLPPVRMAGPGIPRPTPNSHSRARQGVQTVGMRRGRARQSVQTVGPGHLSTVWRRRLRDTVHRLATKATAGNPLVRQALGWGPGWVSLRRFDSVARASLGLPTRSLCAHPPPHTTASSSAVAATVCSICSSVWAAVMKNRRRVLLSSTAG